MNKATLVPILGVWLAILPFLGFPKIWDDVFIAFTGVALIGVVVYPRLRDFLKAFFDQKDGFTPTGEPDPAGATVRGIVTLEKINAWLAKAKDRKVEQAEVKEPTSDLIKLSPRSIHRIVTRKNEAKKAEKIIERPISPSNIENMTDVQPKKVSSTSSQETVPLEDKLTP